MAFQAEKKRIADEANRKRSETQKGNDNAAKEREEKTVVEQTVPLLFDNHKGRLSKANASNTNRGAVIRGDKLAKERPDLAQQVMRGELKPAEAHRQMKRDQVADEKPAGMVE